MSFLSKVAVAEADDVGAGEGGRGRGRTERVVSGGRGRLLCFTPQPALITHPNSYHHPPTMAQHIRDDRVVPPNYFPNNDISALDAGSWNLNLPTKVVDRAGRAVPEEEQAPKDGHRRILAALDFTKQEHVAVRLVCGFHNAFPTVVALVLYRLLPHPDPSFR